MKTSKPGELYKKYMSKHPRKEEGKKHEAGESKGMERKEHMKSTKKWIAGAIKKPGALHRALKVPAGKNIPEKKLAAAAKKGGKMGKRARLAETLKSFHKTRKHKTMKEYEGSNVDKRIDKITGYAEGSAKDEALDKVIAPHMKKSATKGCKMHKKVACKTCK